MGTAQLEVAKKAALKAGRMIIREGMRLDSVEVREKAQFDFVTSVDTASEEIIKAEISQFFPRHAILAEESGACGAAGSENLWIVDPLDGTTNFVHGLPQYAVSIAYCNRGRIEAAAVYDPCRNELFWAERGRGAFLNDRRIRVSRRKDFSTALIGTGFPFRAGDDYSAFMPRFEAVARVTAGLRRAGSAALDLCWVACGRLDGYWEAGLRSWDIAAGSLLVLEAGGLVTDLSGGEEFLQTGGICCGTPKVFAPLLAKAGRTGPGA